MARVNVMRLATGLLLSAELTAAHFSFIRIARNGVWFAPLQGVRNKTSHWTADPIPPGQNFPDRWYNHPTYARDSPDSVRCGRDTQRKGVETDVLTVHAGDEIEFAQVRGSPDEDRGWNEDMFKNCPDNRGICCTEDRLLGGICYQVDINHDGPLYVHLSKVPDGQDVRTYDGSGDWVKVYTLGLEWRKVPWRRDERLWWIPANGGKAPSPRFKFRIPSQTPAGQYLMRMDLMWPTTFQYQADGAQMYPTCAQLNIVNESGNSSSSWPKGVKIPEVFKSGMPGTVHSNEMSYRTTVDKDYVYPGGPLWDGETYKQDKPDLTPV